MVRCIAVENGFQQGYLYPSASEAVSVFPIAKRFNCLLARTVSSFGSWCLGVAQCISFQSNPSDPERATQGQNAASNVSLRDNDPSNFRAPQDESEDPKEEEEDIERPPMWENLDGLPYLGTGLYLR